MNFQINDKVQNIVVDLLRVAFTTNPDYPYVVGPDGHPDLDNTLIAIYREYPKVMPSFPVVIVQAPLIDSMPRTLGDDALVSTYANQIIDGVAINGMCFQSMGGCANLSLTISITGITTTERENILDYIVTYLRHDFRWYLDQQAIEITNITRTGETIEIYGSELLYLSNVSCDLFLEWGEIKGVDTILKDTDLCVSIFGQDGSCFLI